MHAGPRQGNKAIASLTFCTATSQILLVLNIVIKYKYFKKQDLTSYRDIFYSLLLAKTKHFPIDSLLSSLIRQGGDTSFSSDRSLSRPVCAVSASSLAVCFAKFINHLHSQYVFLYYCFHYHAYSVTAKCNRFRLMLYLNPQKNSLTEEIKYR